MGKILILLISIIIFVSLLLYILKFSEIRTKDGVILIGLDGAEWNIVNSLMRQGKLPNFEKIKRNGVSGRIASIPLRENLKYGTNYLSPVIWTSIATGRNPHAHKIIDFYINNEIAGSNHRKVPAIWNILTYYNKKSAIIGWYASFPAEEINGYIVSSRLGLWGYKISYNIPITSYKWTNDKYRETLTYPPNLLFDIEKNILQKSSNMNSYINEYKNNVDCSISIQKKSEEDVYICIIWSDVVYLEIFNYLLSKENFDFASVYFDGIDVIQHKFWRAYDKDFKDILSAYKPECNSHDDAIVSHYILMDKRIGEILDKFGKDYKIVIISDHGGRSFPYNKEFYTHSPYGIFFIIGKGIKKNYTLRYPLYNVLDILPTILYSLDVPISKELEGKIMKDIFEIPYLMQKEPTWVNNYMIKAKREDKKKKIMDEEIREKLKGLGYIQ